MAFTKTSDAPSPVDDMHSVPVARSLSVYWQLIRPGLLLTVLFSMTVAALATAAPPTPGRLLHALLGTALLIAGATAVNQLMESRGDAAMKRTAMRPLPSGRLTVWQAAAFAAFASLVGIAYLALMQPPIMTSLAALSWLLYVFAYTPLKRSSVWHIPVGAVAGALPILLGAATADAAHSPSSLILFGIVFFWQFPHTAAIGWIYREQYACSKARVAAVVDPSGRLSGRLALFGAAGLLLTSLMPVTLHAVGWAYVAIALSLGVADMALAARFRASPTDANARALWKLSLLHLPALLTSLLLALR